MLTPGAAGGADCPIWTICRTGSWVSRHFRAPTNLLTCSASPTNNDARAFCARSAISDETSADEQRQIATPPRIAPQTTSYLSASVPGGQIPLVRPAFPLPVWGVRGHQQEDFSLLDSQTSQANRNLACSLGEMAEVEGIRVAGLPGARGIPHHGDGVIALLTPMVHYIFGDVEPVGGVLRAK